METTRRTGRVFVNTWTCPQCGKRNNGTDRECAGCGRPRGKETKYDHDHVAVLEGKDAEPYLTGPDWFCECCESYNSANLSECKSCGAPKGASKNYFEIRKEQEEKEHRTKVAEEAAQAAVEEPEQSENPVKRLLSKKGDLFSGLFLILSLLAIFIPVILFFSWALTPEQKTGTVTDLTWETSVSLEELVTDTGEGWSLPIGARETDREWRYYDTVQEIDHYETKTVPVTKYRTVQDPDYVWYTYEDQGNGVDAEIEHRETRSHEEPYTDYETQQVPVYKDVDVYQWWYSWEMDRWTVVDTETTKGSKGTEHDPVLAAYGRKERLTPYSRSWRVYIETEEDADSFGINKSLYGRLEIGDVILYETDKLGSFKILEINGEPMENGE